MNQSPFMWPYRPSKVIPSIDAPPRPECPPQLPCMMPGCGNTWCHSARSEAEQPALIIEKERRQAAATNHRVIGVSLGDRTHPTGIVVAHIAKQAITVEKTTTIKERSRYAKIARHLSATSKACQTRSRVMTVLDVTGVGEAIVGTVTGDLSGRRMRVAMGQAPPGIRKLSRISVVAALTAVLEAGRLKLPADKKLLAALEEYQDDVSATRGSAEEIWRTQGDCLPLALGLCVWAAEKTQAWGTAWRPLP